VFAQPFLRELGKSLLDFVYPPECLACGQGIEDAGAYLCAECWGEILAWRSCRCQRCGCPAETPVRSCANCAEWEPAFERAVVLGGFEGAMQQALHALKFRHQQALGVELGRRMGQALGPLLEEVDLLVPVPLHPARQRERGYNQSLGIARGLAEMLRVEVRGDLVERRVNTRQQARLEAPRRRQNLLGAFRCPAALPPHRCIGLVDDVVTTGATLDACARALVRAGALRVWALALASPFRQSGSLDAIHLRT
jgi:ComF family protein